MPNRRYSAYSFFQGSYLCSFFCEFSVKQDVGVSQSYESLFQVLLKHCSHLVTQTNHSGCAIVQVFFLLRSYILCSRLFYFLRSCRLLIFHSPLLPPNSFDKHSAAAKAAMELNDAICQLPPGVMKPAGV